MFERTKIDNTSKSPVACELVLDDGRELLGHLLVANLRGIVEELNAPGSFIEFELVDELLSLTEERRSTQEINLEKREMNSISTE